MSCHLHPSHHLLLVQSQFFVVFNTYTGYFFSFRILSLIKDLCLRKERAATTFRVKRCFNVPAAIHACSSFFFLFCRSHCFREGDTFLLPSAQLYSRRKAMWAMTFMLCSSFFFFYCSGQLFFFFSCLSHKFPPFFFPVPFSVSSSSLLLLLSFFFLLQVEKRAVPHTHTQEWLSSRVFCFFSPFFYLFFSSFFSLLFCFSPPFWRSCSSYKVGFLGRTKKKKKNLLVLFIHVCLYWNQ